MSALRWIPACALAVACLTSPPVSRFEPAHTPAGVRGTLLLRTGPELHAELLEVRDDALVVLAGKRVVVVPYPLLRSITVDQVDSWNSGWGRTFPPADLRERLRYLSRFPYGIPEPALAALLREAGQEQMDSVRVRR